VEAHDMGGPAGGHGEVDDGDRGGVRGEDGLRVGDHLVPLTEDLQFHLPVLGDGLDDELPVRQCVRVVGEGEPGLVAVGLGELPAPRTAIEGGGDAAAAGGGRLGSRFGHGHIETAHCGDLGDAGAHEAAADDAETGDAGHEGPSCVAVVEGRTGERRGHEALNHSELNRSRYAPRPSV
jgi:hypothetical protein